MSEAKLLMFDLRSELIEMEKVRMSETKKPTVPFLAETWHKLTTGPVGGVPKFTPREYGQFKMLRNRLEDVTVFVIVWAAANWRVFSQRAMYERGLSSAAAKPHIGYLLAHYDVAVNMMHETVPWEVAPLMARWKKAMEDERENWAEEDPQPSH